MEKIELLNVGWFLGIVLFEKGAEIEGRIRLMEFKIN
jgi:hypothetical protein